MAEARPAGTAAPRPPAARGGARGLPPPGTSPAPPHPLPHAGRRGRCPLRPSAPVLCPPRSPRGRGPVLLPAERIPDSPPPHTHTHSRHLLSQERGGESASPQRRRPHPSRPGEPPLHLPLSRRRAQAPLSPEHGARRRGCPRAGDSAPAATSHPGAPRPRGQRRQRPPSPTPSPRPPPRQRSSPPPPRPPGSPAFAGHRRPQGNKETQPGPAPRRRCLPAAGPPAASAPAAAGSAAALPLPGTWRRGGAAAGRPPAVPERGWSPRSGARGAAGRVGQRQLPGAADGVCPRLPEPAAAALAAGCRSSSWAAMQRGKRETERERERGAEDG